MGHVRRHVNVRKLFPWHFAMHQYAWKNDLMRASQLWNEDISISSAFITIFKFVPIYLSYRWLLINNAKYMLHQMRFKLFLIKTGGRNEMCSALFPWLKSSSSSFRHDQWTAENLPSFCLPLNSVKNDNSCVPPLCSNIFPLARRVSPPLLVRVTLINMEEPN